MMTWLVGRLLRFAPPLVALVTIVGTLCSVHGCDNEGVCGDGVKNTGEECDGEDVGGANCQDLGYQSGALGCYFTCTYLRTDCTDCGNNHKELREECDGPNLGGESCDTLGYYGGTLACYGHCEFDLSDCAAYGWCGDGVINGDEECDDNDTPWDGCTDCSKSEFRVPVDPEEHGRIPALAVDHDGSFVIVWEGGHNEIDRNTQGIYGRKFQSDGGAIDAELRMSEPPEMIYPGSTYRTEPDVAGSGSGRFVVAWRLEASDANIDPGLYGQVFEQYGSPTGLVFRIDQDTDNAAELLKAAMADDGQFAVVWQAYGLDSEGSGIGARLYDRQGVPTTGVVLVNSTEIGDQKLPEISMSATGRFTVVWLTNEGGGTFDGLFAQWFDVDGSPMGPEVEVSADGISPAVDTTPDGTTMIVWTESCALFSHYCLWAQTFDASGMALAPALQIDEHPARSYYGKRIALRNDGSAIITWAARASPILDYDVFFQLIGSAGNLLGTAQPTHTYSEDDQGKPDIESDATGGFVITWESPYQDGHGSGIYAQRYDAAGNPLGRNH